MTNRKIGRKVVSFPYLNISHLLPLKNFKVHMKAKLRRDSSFVFVVREETNTAHFPENIRVMRLQKSKTTSNSCSSWCSYRRSSYIIILKYRILTLDIH